MTDRDINSIGSLPVRLKPEDVFRPNLAAEIDDTRTWVDPRGYRLSDRLWSARAADRAQIEKVLRSGLARGASPLQTANALENLLNPYYQPRRNPDTFRILPKSKQPPGVATKTPRQGPGTGPFRPRNSGLGSYAARRLARTETTRAFGDATMKAAKANPFVHRMRWRLSGHHHDSDQCDRNARESSRHNEPGVYWLDEVPRYPDHPHEMCTLNPVVLQQDIDGAIPRIREYIRTGHMPPPGYRDYDNKSLLPWDLVGQNPPPTPAARPSAAQTARQQFGEAPNDPNRPAWMRELDEIKRVVGNKYTATGAVDEADVRRAGSIFRRNLKDAPPNPRMANADVALKKAQADFDKVNADLDAARVRDTPDYALEDKLWRRRTALQKKLRAAETDWERASGEGEGNVFGRRVQSTLADVRPVGSTQKHPWAKGSATVAKTSVDSISDKLPVEWWETSIDYGPVVTKKIGRGFYRHNPGRGVSELNTSGWNPNDLKDTSMHEFGHRMEYTRPHIRAAEESFYQRRTAGEELVPLQKLQKGYGYGREEVVRPDDFSQPYSGKDYGGRAWEIVSMGVEDVYSHGRAPRWIENDEDYLDFVLGVLAIL